MLLETIGIDSYPMLFLLAHKVCLQFIVLAVVVGDQCGTI